VAASAETNPTYTKGWNGYDFTSLARANEEEAEAQP